MRAKQTKNRFIYVLTLTVAAFGLIALSRPILFHLSPAADSAKALDIDLREIKAGEYKLYAYEKRAIHVRHLTRHERNVAINTPSSDLRDKQSYSERFRYLPDGRLGDRFVVVYREGDGMGCTPRIYEGDYRGWSDNCKPAQYDVLGRIRKGYGSSNMTVPNYKYISENKIRIYPAVTMGKMELRRQE